MKHATLSLVLPVRNAAVTLESVIQDCLLVIPHYFTDFEIILVDDGSQDDTLSIAHRLAATHDPVMVIHHARRRGYAQALDSGIYHSRGDYILTMSLDNAIGINELARLLPYVEQHDMVLGYRHKRALTGWQRMPDQLFHHVSNWLLGLNLHDMDSRFALLRAAIFDQFPRTAHGRLLHVELYARIWRQNNQCIQVGVHEYRAIQPGRTGSRMHLRWLPHVLRLWSHLRFEPTAAKPAMARVEQTTRPFWQQKVVWGLGLAVAARSLWLLMRRRAA